jgi:molybdopterin-guanine dinucleotide biosynthesis protein B
MKIFGVTGWKNSGKTGLVERLVAEFIHRGLSVSTVKHAHHTFDVDHPGRDSYRHRVAGAKEVLLVSKNRWAIMHELRDEDEPNLAEILTKLEKVDLVIIEGFKRDRHPKIEAFREEAKTPVIALQDDTIVAVAASSSLPDLSIPVFDLDSTSEIADFISNFLDLNV